MIYIYFASQKYNIKHNIRYVKVFCAVASYLGADYLIHIKAIMRRYKGKEKKKKDYRNIRQSLIPLYYAIKQVY